jgi:DNA polymerase
MDDALDEVVRDIAACRRCRLWASRRNTVPGEGSHRAGVMLIGEAPGYHEDLQGRPFIGDAGRILDRLLTRAGLSRDDVYICNVLKCRPPNNRDPTPAEVQACTPYLRRQLDLLRPQLVVPLGRFAAAVMATEAGNPFTSISKMRGTPFDVSLRGHPTVVIPTYHPAAALYNPRYRDALDEDFAAVKTLLAEKAREP